MKRKDAWIVWNFLYYPELCSTPPRYSNLLNQERGGRQQLFLLDLHTAWHCRHCARPSRTFVQLAFTNQCPRHERAAWNLIAATEKFRGCSHFNTPSTMTIEGVRNDCCNALVKACTGDNLVFFCTARVLIALCEAQCEADNSRWKTIAYIVCVLLRRSLEVRRKSGV